MTREDFLKYLGQQVTHYKTQYSLTEGKEEPLAVALCRRSARIGTKRTRLFPGYDGGNDKDIEPSRRECRAARERVVRTRSR